MRARSGGDRRRPTRGGNPAVSLEARVAGLRHERGRGRDRRPPAVYVGDDEPSAMDESGEEIPGNISGEDGPFDVANSDYQFYMDWTTTGHTGVDVPLTAEGPGSARLTGNYENTEVYHAMARALDVARR